jgi:hypothetical protein
MLKRNVYANGGFRTVRAMKARVKYCWDRIPRTTLQNLAHSLVDRIEVLTENPSKKLKY